VRHTGEIVAAVIASDTGTARDAAQLIEIDYEPLGVTIDCEQATQPGAPQIHADIPSNISFHWKMGLFVLAGINLLYLTAFDEPWEISEGKDAGAWAKTMAASSIGLWIGVMYFGRMLPFIGNSF